MLLDSAERRFLERRDAAKLDLSARLVNSINALPTMAIPASRHGADPSAVRHTVLAQEWLTQPWACRTIGVFLEIKEYESLGAGTLDALPADFKAANVFDTKYWVPDANVSDLIITIDTVDDILPTLEVRMPACLEKHRTGKACSR